MPGVARKATNDSLTIRCEKCIGEDAGEAIYTTASLVRLSQDAPQTLATATFGKPPSQHQSPRKGLSTVTKERQAVRRAAVATLIPPQGVVHVGKLYQQRETAKRRNTNSPARGCPLRYREADPKDYARVATLIPPQGVVHPQARPMLGFRDRERRNTNSPARGCPHSDGARQRRPLDCRNTNSPARGCPHDGPLAFLAELFVGVLVATLIPPQGVVHTTDRRRSRWRRSQH